MVKPITIVALTAAVAALVSETGVPPQLTGAPGGQPTPPPARSIPGVNARDQFPAGCVGCHVKLPDKDVRLSSLMQRWMAGVDEALLAHARAAAPPGVSLTGRHPAVPSALDNIPASCMRCHGAASTTAPSFAKLLHLVHLRGGEHSHFMTIFQGECTHCHKLDPASGTWRIASGPET